MKKGRWPANIIHDGSPEVMRLFPQTKSGNLQPHHKRGQNVNVYGDSTAHPPSKNFGGDSGSAGRFFICCPYTEEDFWEDECT